MIVRAPVVTYVERGISLVQIGRYLDRTGWELVQIGEWSDNVLGAFKIARWRKDREVTIRDDGGERDVLRWLGTIAAAEEREAADVLLDVAKEAP